MKSGQGPHPARWAVPTPGARLSCAPSVMMRARDTVPRVARGHGARRARRACGGSRRTKGAPRRGRAGPPGGIAPCPPLGAAYPEPWWAGHTPSSRLSCAPSVMLCARDTVPRVARRHGARRARRACGGHGAQRVRRDADVRGQGALPPRTPLAIFGDLWCWLHVCRSLYIREGMLHLAIPAAWPEQPPSASAGGRHLSQLRRRAHKKILPQRGRCHGESRDG